MRSESQEQIALFMWAKLQSKTKPELALLYHIPNGGHRSKIAASRLKKEGVKAGVPDVFLPVSRGGFHGLYIEMKAAGGRPSTEQVRWLDDLASQGYMAVICYGYEAAKSTIENYLEAKSVKGS